MGSEEKRQEGVSPDPKAVLAEADPSQVKSLAEQLEQLPEKQQLQVGALLRSQIVSYRGPLPTPEDFQRYNQVLDGAAERILRMAEEEQAGRGIERNQRFIYKMTRVILAGTVSIGLVVVVGFATYYGLTLIAVPLGMVGFLSLVARLVFGRRD